MRTLRRLAYAQRGSTLVELIVATVIMSVGILGLFGSFRFITRSIFVSRGQTLATNLGQERIEYLKNINYYALLVTTAPATDNSFTPGVDYDTANYPPETISIAGISYTRYTNVSMAQVDNDVISEVAFTYPDTGMKLITVNVIWMDNGVKKKWTLRNLLENPYVNPLDATITGTVSRSGGGVVAGALVNVEQNPDWNAYTDAAGAYTFRVYHGTYSVRASSAGFYDAVSTGTVVAKSTTKNIGLTLSAIATGTVSGAVWVNPALVISQVVANTNTFVANGAQASVEYIELFNPTTFPIVIGASSDPYPRNVNLTYYDEDSNYSRSMFASAISYTQAAPWVRLYEGNYVHISTFVPPKSHYLIANATFFMISDRWVTPDAYYYTTADPDYPDYLRNDRAGGLYLIMAGWNYLVADQVGWADNDNGGTIYEGTYIPDIGGGNDGLGTPAGKQIVRVSSPGVNASLIDTLGRAYDSNYNTRDFLYTYAGSPSDFHRPYNVAAGTFPVVAGKPMHSALISAGDTNSGSTLAATVYITSGSLSLPYAPFVLRGVTTGTWEVAITTLTYPYAYHCQTCGGDARSFNFNQIISTVAIIQNAVTSIPNATTVSSWTASGRYHVFLDSVTSMGYVKGQVTNAIGAPISGIKIEGGGNSRTTASNGLFFFSVSSGTFNLIANPNNLNASYIQSIQQVTVSSASVTTQDFSLALGAKVQGYATSGTTPLSNIVFTVLNGALQAGAGTTDATGVFNIRNMSTGTYTVAPVLEVGQDASPNSVALTLTSTGTVFVGTFTVSGAFGSIGGTVTDANGLVTSGALIIASTASIASTPPAVVGSSAPAMTPYYMISSKADGTYTLPVRGANTYYIAVYVPVVEGASVSITTKTYSTVYVAPSGTKTQNITIP